MSQRLEQLKMKEITISEFKTHCAALINEVSKTGNAIRIIRRGKPVAEVIPASSKAPRKLKGQRKLGTMAGTVKVLGDIVSPIVDLNDFEAYRD